MNYYSHHIGDFDRATRHLTRIERSVYLDLIFVYYDTEAPLSLDVAMLCRKIVARTEEEKAAVLAVLDEFFHETPSGWFHDRCEEELDAYRKSKSQASAAGKASAAARAERRAAAMGSPTGVERRGNENPTTVERPLNDRATEAQRTINEPATNQEPITNNQKPVTKNQEPRASEVQKQPQHQPLSDADAPDPGEKAAGKKAEPGTGKVWAAYATAYWNRYGVEPVRNATVNGQISNLVRRLGADDAEHVASFYLTHRNRYYVEKMHSVGPLLADCEKLRTEWATSSQMTSTRAAQEDRTQTNYDAFAPLIAEAQARERGN